MLIKRAEQVAAQTVTMPGASGVRMRLMLGREDGATNFAMRIFEVEPGGHTPLHKHNYEHEVLVLEGKGQVIGGRDGSTIRPIAAGDILLMPANETHQFRNPGNGGSNGHSNGDESGQPLRFVCLVPSTFDCSAGCQQTPGS